MVACSLDAEHGTACAPKLAPAAQGRWVRNPFRPNFWSAQTMFPYVRSFLHDERGSVLVTEWVFLATILMIGILPLVAATRTNLAQLRLAHSLAAPAELEPGADVARP
jgi:hypothetical protein